jgi:hypothetical protein
MTITKRWVKALQSIYRPDASGERRKNSDSRRYEVSPPDLLNSCFGYVAVSRASHKATIVTDDLNRLAQQIGTGVSKSSALERTQNLSRTQDSAIGIGL